MNITQLMPYAVLAMPVLVLLIFLSCLSLFFSLRGQLRQLIGQQEKDSAILERVVTSVAMLDRFNLEGFDTRVSELESRKPITIPEPSAPDFIGASRRGQVLRLHRSGESAVHIAQTLGVSQGEVKLTLQLQDLFSQAVQ